MITALTVAKAPIRFDYPGLVHKCLHGRIFNTAVQVQQAWFDAIDLVDTPYFFFIDDDDDLPLNYSDVLAMCIDTHSAVAYTDENIGGERRYRKPYSQQAHLKNPTLIHHLALCDTSIAKEVIQKLPIGNFWPEMMLYWAMAKVGQAAHVPEIGYNWHRKSSGLHKAWFTVLGMYNSHKWCSENL